MMGPDPDGNVGNFGREDFTLLNLSKSSSTPSSSDELFAHHQHQLPPSNPNKKKRLRLKRKGGYSVRQNRTSDENSQVRSRGVSPLFGSGFTNSSTLICALILLLLCWSATLSWLMFSLRNELVATNANLATFEALNKDLPMDLAKINQTIETLEGNVTDLSALVASLKTQLNNTGKNLTDTNGLVKELQKNLGLLGSKQNEISAKVEALLAKVEVPKNGSSS